MFICPDLYLYILWLIHYLNKLVLLRSCFVTTSDCQWETNEDAQNSCLIVSIWGIGTPSPDISTMINPPNKATNTLTHHQVTHKRAQSDTWCKLTPLSQDCVWTGSGQAVAWLNLKNCLFISTELGIYLRQFVLNWWANINTFVRISFCVN